MTVNLAVASGRAVVTSYAVRLADSKVYRVIIAIKGALKCLKIASAIEPKAHHARTRQINVALKIDGHIGP